MNKKEIKQEPFASTLMSSVKAAFDYYYDTPLSNAMLFGMTGHAFVIHITNGLGPCAPYVWEMKPFNKLCKDNLGVDMLGESYMVTTDSSNELKHDFSNKIIEHLSSDHLLLLSSYEYQIIKDYDEEYLYTTSPWDDTYTVTPNLKKDTLEGIKDFMTIFKISKTEKKDIKEGIKQSIQYAISLFEDPNPMLDSGLGIHAYDFWLEKITDENAKAHGNWWSSTVWSESRKMASDYMLEIKSYFEKDDLLNKIAKLYQKSAELLHIISDREKEKDAKIVLINQLKDNELIIYDLLKKL